MSLEDDLPPSLSIEDELTFLPFPPDPESLIVIDADGQTWSLRYEQLEAFVRGLPPYGPEQI